MLEHGHVHHGLTHVRGLRLRHLGLRLLQQSEEAVLLARAGLLRVFSSSVSSQGLKEAGAVHLWLRHGESILVIATSLGDELVGTGLVGDVDVERQGVSMVEC